MEELHQEYTAEHKLNLFVKNCLKLLQELGVEFGQEEDVKRKESIHLMEFIKSMVSFCTISIWIQMRKEFMNFTWSIT